MNTCVMINMCEGDVMMICMMEGMKKEAGGGGRRRATGGLATKNKNPTRRCGEQATWGPMCNLFVKYMDLNRHKLYLRALSGSMPAPTHTHTVLRYIRCTRCALH